MILDNTAAGTKKVHEWISDYTEAGAIDAVTGYFTIGALAWLSEQVNDKVAAFRFVIGDIASHTMANAHRPLDLLNERVSADSAFSLASAAKKAVAFLSQDKVLAKTVEPNFCHAKCLVFKPSKKDDRDCYYVAGSSNLTEAGIGLKQTNNVELNLAETGNNDQYRNLVKWFDDLWNKPETHFDKTVAGTDGKETTVNFKQYLIDEISKVFQRYTPLELYLKVLAELFSDPADDDPDFARHFGKLENTAIWEALYEFQKKGALSLIRMLQKHGGAILADAVGLGKTFTALAVIKFAQFKGREVVVICPKKLEQNWRQYRHRQGSRFESDRFDYLLRFHTDMNADRLATYDDTADTLFVSDKPKLFVIDESHNLRNDKSARYQFLAEKILAKNPDAQILLLSATPINNSLLDVRNQFKLIAKGANDGFKETLSVNSLEKLFADAQKEMNRWMEKNGRQIPELIAALPHAFFRLTDALTVARTRLMIQQTPEGVHLAFPRKTAPENFFETPVAFGHYKDFDGLLAQFPPSLSAYLPAYYADRTSNIAIRDEAKRDFFLVRMMFVLLVKRLESSWVSFAQTIGTIRAVHQAVLAKVRAYENLPDLSDLSDLADPSDLFDEDDDEDAFNIGKRKVRIAEIADIGHLDAFKRDLKKDLDALDKLNATLEIFKRRIDAEQDAAPSADTKLQNLIDLIRRKQASGEGNPKVLIFTTYADTAEYLFRELSRRGLRRLAVVTGSECKDDAGYSGKKFTPILERFAPVASGKTQSPENAIDILIATDVLSEGQNLQDADFAVNYDIHWNPVRVIQRVGRIDRLGSPNPEIYSANFWPAEDVEGYLTLRKRVEDRMATMRLMGSEVPKDFTDTFAQKAAAPDFESQQIKRMLEQMKVSLDDIETADTSLGFNDLSLDRFRQDWLYAERAARERFTAIPNGVFTGFKAEDGAAPGLIAFLGFPARKHGSSASYAEHRFAYIDAQGGVVLSRREEILGVLAAHKNAPRLVPAAIDAGDPTTIATLSQNLRAWLEKEGCQTATIEIADLLGGTATPVTSSAKTMHTEQRFQPKNFDLICWFVLNPSDPSDHSNPSNPS